MSESIKHTFGSFVLLALSLAFIALSGVYVYVGCVVVERALLAEFCQEVEEFVVWAYALATENASFKLVRKVYEGRGLLGGFVVVLDNDGRLEARSVFSTILRQLPRGVSYLESNATSYEGVYVYAKGARGNVTVWVGGRP